MTVISFCMDDCNYSGVRVMGKEAVKVLVSFCMADCSGGVTMTQDDEEKVTQ